MEDNAINTIFFENLKNDEKFILCKTIARIFAKRLLKDERSKFFPKHNDSSLKIEVGHAENLSIIGGYGNCRYGWIPDEKFKVNAYKEIPGIYTPIPYMPDYLVWLDIKWGENAFFEKEKRDIMNWKIWKNPDNIVLSCYMTVNKNQSKINLQFYLLQLGKGWKKINQVFYSSLSDFNDLSTSERGEIGESLGKIFAKRLLYENRSLFFPEFDKDFLRIEDDISIDCSGAVAKNYEIPNTHWERVNIDSWIPDTILQVLTNPDNIELKYETFPKKIVYLEVKTGKNARLMRDQKNDIEAMSHVSNFIMLVCSILPEYIQKSESQLVRKLILNFQMVKEGKWETIKKNYYSDF
jgi:hypothetical protein